MVIFYKIISIYLLLSFTIGTLYSIEVFRVFSVVLFVLLGLLLIPKKTRNLFIIIYNNYALPNMWIVFCIFGPLHFYLSVENELLRNFGILIGILTGSIGLFYKIKSGDYKKWEI